MGHSMDSLISKTMSLYAEGMLTDYNIFFEDLNLPTISIEQEYLRITKQIVAWHATKNYSLSRCGAKNY